MTGALTVLWQRVLQREPIGAEENFFDLGGDSTLAVELLNEVSKLCGRDLPPVMIYQTPTIALLAEILEHVPVPRLPPLVQLKPGIDESPLFIAHGLGGSAMDFFQPIRYLKTVRPVYGMQAKGYEGAEEPLDRIEDMAEYFLKAVREIQPAGPYYLAGFSLGGLITLEMAQRLSAGGERIALLAMLDAYPHVSTLSPGQRVRLAGRQASLRAAQIANQIIHPRTGEEKASAEKEELVVTTEAMLRVRESDKRALQRYHPRFYSGEIKFAKAAISTEFPDDPAAVWAHLAGKFELKTVPGDHVGIITTHYESLASVLSEFLQEAAQIP
jgi:thioesterase domain-containing protein/acyl carrier protein